MRMFLFSLLIMPFLLDAQSVGIGTTMPDASAKLDVSSEEQGFLPPRMRSNMRIAIVNPATGLIVYDTNTESYWYRGVSSWIELSDSKTAPWKKSLNGFVYNTNTNFVQVSNTTEIAVVEGVLGLRIKDPSTNDVKDILSIQRGTTGTAENGIGGAIIFRNEANNGAYSKAGRITSFMEDAVLPNTKSAMTFQVFETNPQISSNDIYFNKTGLTIGANMAPTSMLDVKGDISVSGEIHNPAKTASANLLPVCYGNVKFDGAINSGSNNFTVNRTSVGRYVISITGYSFSYLTCVATVTPSFLDSPQIAVTTSFNGDLIVRIFNLAGNLVDGYFNFVVHKP